jgi:hypothetical protein
MLLPIALIAGILTGCATGHQVSYQQDVRPVIEKNCIACHIPPQGVGYRTGGLDLTSHQTLMRGTVYGPVIKPGDSQHSILNMLVEVRADACIRMPHEKGYPLTPQEIDLLHRWVDQGAKNN